MANEKVQEKETVKLSGSVLEIYREWATRSGRTLSGLIEKVLSDAAAHYRDGTVAGLDRAAEIMSNPSNQIGAKR
jgi:hypothetical protein